MSIDPLLIHTANVTRRTRTSTQDAWGQDTGEHSYTAHLSSVACRVEDLTLREREAQREGVRVTHRIFFRPGLDIINTDRVESVTNEEGNTIGNGTFYLDSVNANPGGISNHHMEALAFEVR